MPGAVLLTGDPDSRQNRPTFVERSANSAINLARTGDNTLSKIKRLFSFE